MITRIWYRKLNKICNYYFLSATMDNITTSTSHILHFSHPPLLTSSTSHILHFSHPLLLTNSTSHILHFSHNSTSHILHFSQTPLLTSSTSHIFYFSHPLLLTSSTSHILHFSHPPILTSSTSHTLHFSHPPLPTPPLIPLSPHPLPPVPPPHSPTSTTRIWKVIQEKLVLGAFISGRVACLGIHFERYERRDRNREVERMVAGVLVQCSVVRGSLSTELRREEVLMTVQNGVYPKTPQVVHYLLQYLHSTHMHKWTFIHECIFYIN